MVNFFRRLFGLGEIVRSVKSGYWTDGDTWDVGHAPQDKANVVISSGHTVEFNGDMKEYKVGLKDLLIRGTLYQTRKLGDYCIKMKDCCDMIVSGCLDLGNADSLVGKGTSLTIYGGFRLKAKSLMTVAGYHEHKQDSSDIWFEAE